MLFRKPSLPEELGSALETGSNLVVQRYLDRGINPNLHDGNTEHGGRTLLILASIHGHMHVMELLIKRGAKVDKADFHNRTPLSWAAEHGQLDAVKLLLTYGANINSEDEQWSTPLAWVMHAGTGGKVADVQHYLISKGAEEKLDHSISSRMIYRVAAQWNGVVSYCLGPHRVMALRCRGVRI